jgi:hypothetical protein
MAPPLTVPFLTVEDDDDWVVSFALCPKGSRRVTLVRAPHLEFMVRPEQRGVMVASGPGQPPALLVAVQWGRSRVDVVSTDQRYCLDVRQVDAESIAAALQVIGKMNFDQRFQLAQGA